jgi:hypothetical protein
MEEDKTSIDGILEKLALITDATQKLFPYGKTLIVFELDEEDFKKVQKNFRKIDHTHKKFTVDISGVEVVFILKGSLEKELNKIEKDQTSTEVLEPVINDTFLNKLLKLFSKKRS